ncbi:MAG: hypothetical protein NUW08_02170, partial [Candidatus Uhrbacteria bacterium]|nr:hypothetical protein [Candidatus Uhrbacteria bacterium]
MRNVFVMMWLSLLLGGCHLSHERAAADAALPESDAHHPEIDAGLDARIDSGMPDAGFNGLRISTSSDMPGSTIPRDATGVRLATFDFEGVRTSGTVLMLATRRTGIGATSDFENVYLFDEYGRRLTTGRTINSMTNIVMFNGLSVTVSEGRVRSLTLVGDMSGSPTTGGQHAFEIVDVSAVTTDGVRVAGDFPIRSAVTTVGVIRAATLTCSKGVDLPDPEVGTSADISNFSLSASDREIELRRLTLIQAGSIDNA